MMAPEFVAIMYHNMADDPEWFDKMDMLASLMNEATQ